MKEMTRKGCGKKTKSGKQKKDKIVAKSKKPYRYKKTNKMRTDGDIDFDERVIRVNKSRSKKHKGGILDTIVHEETHRLHPEMHEKTVRKKTTAKIKKMSPKSKARQYSKLKGRKEK